MYGQHIWKNLVAIDLSCIFKQDFSNYILQYKRD